MKAIFLVAITLASLCFCVFEIKILYYSWIWSVILFFFMYIVAVSVWIFLALILINPIDGFLKKRLVKHAKIKLNKYDQLKIIGIAGSYGKTTAKEFVYAALNGQTRVLKTPENINTPVGIARLILKTNLNDFDIFIVEMGEYKIGDVKEICELTRPDISIVTGVNEAHAERMGNIECAKKAIFEVVEFAKKDTKVFVNFDDDNAYNYAGKLNYAMFYGLNENSYGFSVLENIFYEKELKRKIVVQIDGNKYELRTSLIGEYVASNVVLCLSVVKSLDLDLRKAINGLYKMNPIPHRLEIIKGAGDVVVIDDSYNGNPDGVSEAIYLLGEFKNRRKIFLTPGLAEMGEKNEEIHKNIGCQLARSVDLVILIKNSATPFIAAGLAQKGFAKEEVVWFNSATDAHKALSGILKPNDVILFQNDWTDNYL